MDDNSYLLPIIVTMFQNIIKSPKPVFWVDFFNPKLDPIFVKQFFVLDLELQYLVRKFFFQFLVESEFGHAAVIVLRKKFVDMSEKELLEFLDQMKHLFSLPVKDSIPDLDPPVLDPNEIAQKCQSSMDLFLKFVQQSTSGKELKGMKFLERLTLLENAYSWVMKYSIIDKETIDPEFRIKFKADRLWEKNPDQVRTKYRSFDPMPSKIRGKYSDIRVKYNVALKNCELYSKFFRRNPDFLELPMSYVHAELKRMRLQGYDNKYNYREIAPDVIKKDVIKSFDFGMFDLDKLIHLLMSFLDFTTPYVKLPPEQASQEVEKDRKDIMIQLRLAIVSILSMTFTKNNVCEITNEVFNEHVIHQINKGGGLSSCEMSRTNVHYDCENCLPCRGCISIGTVSKYGDHFKIVPKGFLKILLFTYFGEYNSFFAFVMFLCQINKKFCYLTNAPDDFQEIQKFLKVVFGLHSHYLPDLAVFLDQYYVQYYRRNLLSMNYTVYELFIEFNITMCQCDMMEFQKQKLNLEAPRRKAESEERDLLVFHQRCRDEDATGLQWKHPQVVHILTGGSPY